MTLLPEMDVDIVNTITLNSLTDSLITKLSLYTDRAQITRVFKFNALAGQNKATITSLSNVIDHDTLRVEGRGAATIHGVTSFKAERADPNDSSPRLDELKDNKEKAKSALERARKAVKSIDDYMAKLDASTLDISKLGEAMDVYDTTEDKWDDKVFKLTKEIEALDDDIEKEVKSLGNKVLNAKLRSVAVIDLFADKDSEVSLSLIYAVSHSGWEAGYDVRIDTQNVGAPAKLIYKANIRQITGEDWKNAPITLETARPTFGVSLPFLTPWNLSLAAPSGSGRGKGLGKGGAMRHRRILPDEDDEDYLLDNQTYVTSRGHVNATFRIPGTTTIPSKDEGRSVTIATLDLEAKLSWVCIPKGDARVHLQATITNTSDYTFLSGDSNVYVDQSFIARSSIDGVSPKEVFECPLGLDPSIRVTYHPLTKSTSSSGFYTKSITHSFSQRMSIHNTKAIAIEGLKLTDHIPVSQDANITVNLISPALKLPEPSSSTVTSNSKAAAPACVKVSEGIIAQWNGADDPSTDVTALGKNGKVDWICALPAFGKANILLQWEVSTGQKEQIYGL